MAEFLLVRRYQGLCVQLNAFTYIEKIRQKTTFKQMDYQNPAHFKELKT